MTIIEMYVGEKHCRFEEFKRPDGRGALNGSETVSSGAVTIADESGNDVSATFISQVSPYNSTQVKYWLTAVTKGVYTLIIAAVTSNGQTLKEQLMLKVL